MHNIKSNFDIIFDICKSIFKDDVFDDGNFFKYPNKPKMSDIQLVALSLTAESLSIDSENHLFNKLKHEYFDDFFVLIDRRNYNRRRKKLACFISEIGLKVNNITNPNCAKFIVDSMPLVICKFSRHSRVKICKEEFDSAPSKGFCASQNNWFYGYKLHGVCSINGIFHSLDITKAEVHDVNFLKNIKQQMSDCVLLGDRGYLSESIQLDLFQTVNIKLEIPKRTNQKDYKPQPYIFRKSRKRIETLFSQLCDQFKIRNNYAKSFEGFKTRILAKITALTLVQFINKFIFDRPINNIKNQII